MDSIRAVAILELKPDLRWLGAETVHNHATQALLLF